jgi:hypothetical protein
LSSTQRIVFLGRMQSRFCRETTLWWFATDGPKRNACWFAGAPIWGVQKHAPWSGRIETPARGWPSGSAADSTRGARLSCLLRWGPVTFHRRTKLPDHGVRERPIAGAGCHATPLAQGIGLLRIQEESMPKNWHELTAFANSDGARGESRLRAVKRLSTQIVCSTGESKSSPTRCKLLAGSSSTLSNSTNGCQAWQ